MRFACLNEDFTKAVELMYDVIKNSTFEEFEKEKIKLTGEITAELDSPRASAMDAYCRTMFAEHYYGNSMTKILENIDSITKEDVIDAYDYLVNNSKKSLAVIGALSKEEIFTQIETTFGKLPNSTDDNFMIEKPELKQKKLQQIDLTLIRLI